MLRLPEHPHFHLFLAGEYLFEGTGQVHYFYSNQVHMNDTEKGNAHLLISGDVIVDISMLYDVAGDDEAYIKMMADTFLQTVPAYVKNINESFSKEDYEQLYQSAHKTKSTLSIVKINNMLEWVKEIEQFAKQKTKSTGLAELVQKVTDRFSIAMQLLKDKFAS